MNGKKRKNIGKGQHVLIVKKEHQTTGEFTEGIIMDILTKSEKHPHGIKVMLETGEVGRVKKILKD